MINDCNEFSYIIGSVVTDCHLLFTFSFSADHSTRGGGSNGGKSIDNGLDDVGGEAFIHPFDDGSGDKRQAVDEGGVTGIHIGASGDNDDEVVNNGTGRFAEIAINIGNSIDSNIFVSE